MSSRGYSIQKIKIWFVLIGLLGVTTSCGSSDSSEENVNPTPVETPSSSNTTPAPYPTVRGQDFHGEKNFAYLINNFTQGKTEPTPWAGYWWPYTGNGIATGGFGGLGSPAGKYDAVHGNTTHSQAWEIKNHGSRVPRLQGWWGHCNGWCAASALFPEPHAPISVNGITFGIGDIKAMLTEVGMSVNADFFGERLDVDDMNNAKYWDTVPDQYFLVLTNYIGKLKQAVLIDRYTGSQIWNQPLAGYRFEYPTSADYLGNSSDAPNVYRIQLTSTIWWLDDGVPPDVQTPQFNYEQTEGLGSIIQSRELRMEVWLDGPVEFDSAGKVTKSGNVIVTRQGEFVAGGAWKMGEGFYVDAWPDYMWIPYALLKPTDPEQDYVNPEIDSDWLKAHILPPGGADDPNLEAGRIQPAPMPSGAPWPGSGGSWPGSGSGSGTGSGSGSGSGSGGSGSDRPPSSGGSSTPWPGTPSWPTTSGWSGGPTNPWPTYEGPYSPFPPFMAAR